MRITGFIWLDEVLDKLVRKHRVEETEVVEVLNGRPQFRFVETGYREGEHAYAAMGQRDPGRYL